MSKKNILFFRNDDVRDTLDDALIEMTEIFVKYNVPITHAVEPANLTPKVVDWLLDMKKKYPEIIEIMQHGYEHKVKNKLKKGEFGGQRTYEEQYKEISHGKQLMDEYFGDQWFPAFNFPYAPYNLPAIKAVNDCGFKVLNSHFNRKFNRQVFYFFGHLLKKGFWMDHHVSWNLDYYPNTDLFEIDMNISFISKYHNEETDCDMVSLDFLKNETVAYLKYPVVGLLLHHRYHDTKEEMKLVDDYLNWATQQNFEFRTMEFIFNKFSKK